MGDEALSKQKQKKNQQTRQSAGQQPHGSQSARGHSKDQEKLGSLLPYLVDEKLAAPLSARLPEMTPSSCVGAPDDYDDGEEDDADGDEDWGGPGGSGGQFRPKRNNLYQRRTQRSTAFQNSFGHNWSIWRSEDPLGKVGYIQPLPDLRYGGQHFTHDPQMLGRSNAK